MHKYNKVNEITQNILTSILTLMSTEILNILND